MTQDNKQLLLSDLCVRLPYGVIGLYSWKNREPYNRDLTGSLFDELKSSWNSTEDSKFLPYLRPMSSMTKEESTELSNIISEWFDKELFYLTEEPFLEYALSKINYSISPLLFDWLNAHHFDYRGLIEKGLAIEVTKENNSYKGQGEKKPFDYENANIQQKDFAPKVEPKFKVGDLV